MTERSSEGLSVRRRKLLFRAWRRGVREMDLIVGRFADVYIDKFDEPSLDEFERLIEVPNAELYAWVTGDENAPAQHLEPGVARVDIGVGKGDVARVVAADEGERLIDGAFGQYATADEIDPQI